MRSSLRYCAFYCALRPERIFQNPGPSTADSRQARGFRRAATKPKKGDVGGYESSQWKIALNDAIGKIERGEQGRLDALINQSEFLSIDRNTMLDAATIWANMRNSGYQTAADSALDADVILGAQALIRSRRYGGSSVVVATENTRHLARICTAPPCTAMDWSTIT
jgi:hypothetical protein